MSTSASHEVEKGPALHFPTPTKVFEGHTGRVTSVAYFSDGERIISGSTDKTVRIWNVESQKQEGDCLMHDFKIITMALSPDGRKLLSGGKNTVLWDLESRTMVWKKGVGLYVAFSPNGKLIAASDLWEIVLLDAETGQRNGEPLLGGTYNIDGQCGLAFSPDGMQLAVGWASGRVFVFDVATGQTILAPFKAHSLSEVSSLVFTLDGQQIITAAFDKFIRVWDAATGQQVGDPMQTHENMIAQTKIVLDADGRRIASISGSLALHVWDLSTRQQIGDSVQPQYEHGFYSVAWSPDGRSIVAGEGPTVVSGPGTTISKIYLWDVPPLDNVTVPVLTEGSPPLPSTGTSQSRPGPLSSVLDLPAGPSPPQSPELNTGPGEGDNWENSTSESFDSVLDLPADGTQPARRRKRRHGRGVPIASTSLLPIPVISNALPAIINSTGPHHPLPQNKVPALPKQPTPYVHTASRVEGSPSHGRTWARRWRQALALPQWLRNRRKPRKGRDEHHERQADHPTVTPTDNSKAPSKSLIPETKTSNTAPNTSSPAPLAPSESDRFVSRALARLRRGKHDPESIEMNPSRPREAHLSKYSRVAKVPHAQADARLVIAPPRRKHRPRPVATAAVQQQGHEQGQGESQEETAVQAQETAAAQSQEPVQVQGTVQNQSPGQGDESEEDSDEAEAEEQEDDAESFRDDGCLNAICFCEYLKWLKYRRELRRRRDD